MASVNKTILLGNLGRDPEVRYSANGAAICNLSIATTYKRKDQSGQQVEETEWHRVVMFSRLAEIAGEYLKKGRQVYIEGRLRTRKWTDSNGIEKYTTEIIADQMQMLGGRDDDQQAQPQQRPPQQQQPTRQNYQVNNQAMDGMADMEDSIPF